MDNGSGKISSLTEEQKDQLIAFRDECLQIGLNTSPMDVSAFRSAVGALYRGLGKKEPQIWTVDSPMIANLLLNVLWGDPLGHSLDNLLGNLKDRFETWPGSDSNLGERLWKNLLTNLDANLESRDDFYGILGNKLEKDFLDNQWERSREFGYNLWDNLLEERPLGDLWSELWDYLNDNLQANLGENLQESLRENLWDGLGNISYFPACFQGSLDIHQISIYVYLHRFVKKIFNAEQMNQLTCWLEVAKSAFWWWPYEKICFVSDRPCGIHRDDNGRLHNPHGMSVKFRDGWGIYSWHGANIPFQLVHSQSALMKLKDSRIRVWWWHE